MNYVVANTITEILLLNIEDVQACTFLPYHLKEFTRRWGVFAGISL